MRRRAVVLVIASMAGAVALPSRARACSSAGDTPHLLDPAMQGIDQMPPTLAPLPAPQITRGKAPEQSGCTTSASSCDDLGSIGLSLQASDDVTPPTQIGYRLTLAAGSLPADLALPGGAIESLGGMLWLRWVDGATDDQEPIDFTLRVVAIDLAGNESAPQTVRVTDGSGGGCTVARHRTPCRGLVFVATAALLLAARRRRDQ